MWEGWQMVGSTGLTVSLTQIMEIQSILYVLFLFDKNGVLIEHKIDKAGPRSQTTDADIKTLYDAHIDALGEHTKTSIWIKLFDVQAHGITFGLISRNEGGEWVVDFVPGYTLMFYPPWAEGLYDT